MKQYIMIWCVLFALNIPSQIKSMGEFASLEGAKHVDPQVESNAPKDVKNVPKDIEAKSTSVAEQGKILAQKKSGSDVIAQNTNLIKTVHGVQLDAPVKLSSDGFANTFNLSDGSTMTTQFNRQTGQPLRSTVEKTITTGRGKNARTKTTQLKNVEYRPDGSMKEDFLIDNPDYNADTAARFKQRGEKYNTSPTKVSHTVEYNADGSVKITSIDPETGYVDMDKSGTYTREELQQKKSNKGMKNNPEVTEQVQKNISPELQRTAEQAIQDPNEDTVGLVLAEVAKEEGLPDSIIRQNIDKWTQQALSAMKSVGASIGSSVLAFINFLSDFISTQQFVDRSSNQPEDMSLQNSVLLDSPYEDYSTANYKIENRSESPTAVNDDRVINPDAEGPTTPNFWGESSTTAISRLVN